MAVIGLLGAVAMHDGNLKRAWNTGIPQSTKDNGAEIADNPVHQELLALQKTHPENVISVVADPKHPGLDAVTYKFTPDHRTISDVSATIAPDQDWTHAMEKVQTYNGGTGITHLGDTVTVNVDTQTGFIVPNPELPPNSADS